MRGALIVGVIAAVLGGAGCTRVNPAYCDEVTHCPNGGVCDFTRNSCHPGDAGFDARPPDGGDGGGDGGGGDGDGGGDGGGDAAVGCTGSSTCLDPAAPICVDGACQACGNDGECLARASATPACDFGRCYECSTYLHCTTPGAPLCGADHTCHPCTSDVECQAGPTPSVGVCVAGGCPDVDDVLWAQAGAADCAGADGSQAKPFCTLAAAATAAKNDARKTIVVKAGNYAYVALKDAGLNGLVVVGQLGGLVPVVQGDTSHPAVEIDLAGVVTLRRLHLRGGGAGSGTVGVLQCATAACTLEELEIEVGGVGVIGNGSALLRVARSEIHDNFSGGLFVGAFSSYVIENNFIYANGASTSSIGGAAFVQSDQTKRFVNNTVFRNHSTSGTAAGLQCDTGDILTTNNILWDNRTNDGIAEVNETAGVPVCTVTYSVIDDPGIATAAGASNTGDNPAFVAGNVTPYDLHLTAGSGGALGGADRSVAPGDDIDGDPRPDQGPTDIGADQRSQ